MSEQRLATASNPLFEGVAFDNVLKCVHCGLCLNVCPTYRELGIEQDSPRGRLYLMRGLWENTLRLEPDVTEPLARCLDCRACETACPSGVPYGELLEKTRGIINEHAPQGDRERIARAVLLHRLLTSTFLLLLLSILMWIYRRLGLERLVRETFIGRLLPPRLAQAHRMIPEFSGRSSKRAHSGVHEPLNRSKAEQTVALFTGCILDVSEASIHAASLQLLRAAGCRVVVPANQTCCGALHVHSGERKVARMLAERNHAAFAATGAEYTIVNAAGCGAQLKEYAQLFSDVDQSQSHERWDDFGTRTIDILEFIATRPDFVAGQRWQTEPIKVLYNAPCHLVHAQRVDKNPRRLLQSLPGIELVPIKEADVCCGSAGVYNLLQPELADAVLGRKIDAIRDTLQAHPDASVLVTANPGCLFQIRGGLERAKLRLRVIHPVELLCERLLTVRSGE